jgi:hypothetical protein
MSKGVRPAGPRPRRPIAKPPQGGPPGAPPDPCSAEIDLAARLEVRVPVGTPVVAVASGREVALVSGGRRVGVIPSPDDAVVRICSAKGWVYQGIILTDGPEARVRLIGART